MDKTKTNAGKIISEKDFKRLQKYKKFYKDQMEAKKKATLEVKQKNDEIYIKLFGAENLEKVRQLRKAGATPKAIKAQFDKLSDKDLPKKEPKSTVPTKSVYDKIVEEAKNKDNEAKPQTTAIDKIDFKFIDTKK